MGVFGLRLDIFVICWFISMGMIQTLDTETGVLGYNQPGRYTTTEISHWGGIALENETNTASDFNDASSLPDIIAAVPGMIFNFFTYTMKAALFVSGVLWNSTIGLHTYLISAFHVPDVWAIPIALLVNLVNFLGLIELWTKLKI